MIQDATKQIENILGQGNIQPCYFCTKPSSFSANMKSHTEFIYFQGTYEHYDVCSEPNVLYFIILILYFKIIQSQGTIQHCDCCTKPYQFGTHVKKHIEGRLPT